jgi:hypothetical protein
MEKYLENLGRTGQIVHVLDGDLIEEWELSPLCSSTMSASVRKSLTCTAGATTVTPAAEIWTQN